MPASSWTARRSRPRSGASFPIPQISSFLDEEGTDRMEEIIRENYYRIKEEVVQIVEREIRRIESDPDLAGLLPKKKQ